MRAIRSKQSKFGVLLWLVSAIILTMSAATVLSQQGPIEVSCQTFGDSFACLEPIFLRLQFRNRSARNLSILYPELGGSLLIDVTSNGKSVDCHSEGHGVRLTKVFLLGPEQTADFHVNLLRYFSMRQPGKYVVQVRYGAYLKQCVNLKYIPDTPIELPPFNVTVRPLSRREGAAIDFLLFRENGPGTVMIRDYRMVAPYIAVLYRDTPYYRYCYYWMAEGERNARNYEGAIDCYKKQLELFPNFPLADKVRFHALLLRHRKAQPKGLNPRLRELLKTTRDLEVRRMIEQRLGGAKKKE